MKTILLRCISISWIFLCTITNLQAQVVFWTDDFESSGPSSGDRDAPNHADGDNGSGPDFCGTGDYFFRTNLDKDVGQGLNTQFFNFSGSFWRGEHLGSCQGNADTLYFTGIDISGLSDFRFTGSFGAIGSTVWESGDGIFVEYSIDDDTYTTGMTFRSRLNLGSGSKYGQLSEDTDNDGKGDGTMLTNSLDSHAFQIAGTGSTLSIRVYAKSNADLEEFAFDDFYLEHSVSLPVELSFFKGIAEDNSNVLSWQTVSELNNSHFEIERSYDATNFSSVGHVQGLGTTLEVTNYIFEDTNPQAGAYYRLKQIDFDGGFEYSNTIFIERTTLLDIANLKLYPVPTTDIINVEFFLKENSIADIQITNNVGMVMLQKKFNYQRGLNKVDFDLNDFPSGVYNLSISCEGYHTTRLITKW